MAYFRTDFSYIQPAIQLIESYVTWLNITKEITFVFTNQEGKYFIFNRFSIILNKIRLLRRRSSRCLFDFGKIIFKSYCLKPSNIE